MASRQENKTKLPLNKKYFVLIVCLGLLFIATSSLAMANQNNYTVSASVLNIRVGPGMSYEVIDQTTSGTSLNVITESNGWYKVRLNDDNVGWVASWYVDYNEPSAYENSFVRVTTPQSHIRQYNNTDSEILGTVDEGTELQVLYKENGWTQVKYLGGLGWIYDDLIEASAASNETVFSPDRLPISDATIVIDAGHGGDDPGTITNDNQYEKNMTMGTASRLAQRLSDSGANVILTRDADESVSLEGRSAVSMDNAADAFISIHYDSGETPNSLSGITTYYYAASDEPLAETINAHLLQNNPGLPLNGVAFGNYYVLRENTQPSVLLELGYLNNDNDLSLILSDNYQNTIVETIYQALLDYFG